MRSIAPVIWYGGKGLMLTILRRHVPPGGSPYCEPYCGGASLFFDREPAPVEVLNDLDGELVNLFRCIQDPALMEELAHRCQWTLYSQAEFSRALRIRGTRQGSPVERAWATFVAYNQGYSGTPRTAGNWSRTFTSRRQMAATPSRWISRLALFDVWRDRLMRVQIDCRDALEVIAYWDNADAVFYVDPPYHPETRSGEKAVYAVEPDCAHHERLVEQLLRCRGAVVLSGYEHAAYEPLSKAGWKLTRHRTSAFAAGRTRGSKLRGDGAAIEHVARTECLWSNRRALEMLHGAGWQQTTMHFVTSSNGAERTAAATDATDAEASIVKRRR